MSLDVYLKGAESAEPCTCEACGHQHERRVSAELFHAGVTHNLNDMADEAGIYDALWHPEKVPITTAVELTPILAAGLAALRADPARFKLRNPKNGWGNYEGLVEFVEKYLNACAQHPGAKVSVSR